MRKINKIQLSIIIVNYNVKFFLEQCLKSVQIAIKNINCETIVVDNNSVDKSNQMISQEYCCTPFYYSNHQPITQM